MQDPALALVEPHEVLEPAQVPLDGIPSFWCVNRTAQLGVAESQNVRGWKGPLWVM